MLVSGSPVDLLSEVPPFVWQILGGAFALGAGITAAIYGVRGLRALGRLATASATDERKAAAKKTFTSVTLYGLLYFFWAVAAGISMQGLIGFAEDNMGLKGPWPYLIFFALDGAAAFCMVLVTKRAGRAASTLTPRLAVWALVALSSWFNITHAPDNPGAKAAWACIPIIAGVLFELAQAESRNQASNPERRLTAIQWLHPIERIRVLLELAADTFITADEATIRVRDAVAAAWLYRLRTGTRVTRGLSRWRTRVALSRANFTDRTRAEEILRRVQIFAQADQLADLDYTTAIQARAALASLIGSEVDPALAAVSAPSLPVKSIVKGSVEITRPTLGEISGPAPTSASRLAPLAYSSTGRKSSRLAVTEGINGHSFAFASPASPPASQNEGERQREEQNEEQPKTRKRPSRATYRAAEKRAIDLVVEHNITRWQDLQQHCRGRSRTWCEDKVTKGQAKLAEIAASQGDDSAPSPAS
ncbi:DUF2637 domain-containing protein [Streptosporangium sp. NPDC050855]|uniref:DUF2637 domain-containing protein n=1 Tax=Streptosporangium sp. NPDC050855 TaxID=3366194 RepID=UPI00379B5DD8